MKENCGHCRFSTMSDAGPGMACRRYPPTVTMNATFMSLFPEVNAHTWCGEFSREKKPEAEAEESISYSQRMYRFFEIVRQLDAENFLAAQFHLKYQQWLYDRANGP